MNHRVDLALLFLAAALCAGGLWPLDPMTARALAAALLLLALLAHALAAPAGGRRALALRLAGMVAGLLVLGLAPTASLALVGIAIFVWARDAARRGPGSDPERATRDEARGAPGGVLLAAPPATLALLAFAVLVEHRLTGPVWLAFEGVAAAVNATSNALFGGTLELGPTALGLDLAALALLLVLASAAGFGVRRLALRAGAAALALGVVLVAYAAGFDAWIDATREFTRAAREEGPGIFRGLWLLAPAVLLVTLAAAPAARAPRPAAAPPLRWLAGPAAACLLVFVLAHALSDARRPAALHESTVLLVRSSSVDDVFDGSPRPSYGYYQKEGYRAFRAWLEAWGCDVRTAVGAELTDADLAGVDLAVYVNPNRPEPGPVERFLADGGSVLLIGDHTPMPAELAELNELLAPFDVRYEFDSVFPTGTAPAATLQAGASGLRGGLAAAPEVCYGVGASLRAGRGANVLLAARWAVGDLGFADSEALLGNRHYDHGDRLSDLPVVVSARAGGGKLVVVGDTGSFVDSAMPFSYPFVHAVVAEALEPSARGFNVSALGILALLALTGYAGRRLAPGAIVALAAGLCLPALGASAWDAAPREGRGVVAIDASLRPQTASLDRNPRTSLKGFAYQCAVRGRLPMVVDDLRAAVAARPELVVLVSPAREPDAALRADLRDYVERGGELWIAVGHEESAPSRPLLDELGVGVLPRPFGSSLQRSAPDGVRYREAWHVVAGKASAAEPVLSTFGFPIALRAARGDGHVTLFGDSYFLCDENVGTGEMTHEETEQLLEQLLAKAR